MKSSTFFLEKSEEYLKLTEDYLGNLIVEHSLDPSSEYVEQRKNIGKLIFKIELLFTEFDNGKLFYDRFDTHLQNPRSEWRDEDYDLKVCKKYLILFIEHLKDFRIE